MNYKGIEYSLNDYKYVIVKEQKKICGESYFFNEAEFKKAVDTMIKRKEEEE